MLTCRLGITCQVVRSLVWRRTSMWVVTSSCLVELYCGRWEKLMTEFNVIRNAFDKEMVTYLLSCESLAVSLHWLCGPWGTPGLLQDHFPGVCVFSSCPPFLWVQLCCKTPRCDLNASSRSWYINLCVFLHSFKPLDGPRGPKHVAE
jgi:hypothetical protein